MYVGDIGKERSAEGRMAMSLGNPTVHSSAFQKVVAGLLRIFES